MLSLATAGVLSLACPLLGHFRLLAETHRAPADTELAWLVALGAYTPGSGLQPFLPLALGTFGALYHT